MASILDLLQFYSFSLCYACLFGFHHYEKSCTLSHSGGIYLRENTIKQIDSTESTHCGN